MTENERIEQELAEAGITARVETHEDMLARYKRDILLARDMIASIKSNYGPPCEHTDTSVYGDPSSPDYDPEFSPALHPAPSLNHGRCPVCAAYEVIAWLEDDADGWQRELDYLDDEPIGFGPRE